MKRIACVGRDGITRDFDYRSSFDPLSSQWSYKVQSVPPLQSGDFFEFVLQDIGDSVARVVMANNHHRPEYTGMGIPEVLLPIIKSEIKMIVESSPSTCATGGVFRTASATKYWERMRNLSRATYDRIADVYRVA
jgi:hypothetical protein